MSRVAALIPAAGRGERLSGDRPKALREIAGIPMLVWAVDALVSSAVVDLLVVAAPADYMAEVRAMLGPDVVVVAGGPTRASSVRCALEALPPGFDIVLVHDAARPFVPVSVVAAVVAAVRAGHPAVVPVLPLPDTVKRVAPNGTVAETPPREELVAVQTPQGFARDVLIAAHQQGPGEATDDAALVERLGRPVWTVMGSDRSFKVTRPIDLLLAEAMALAVRRGEPG